jgi:hypothetical protein
MRGILKKILVFSLVLIGGLGIFSFSGIYAEEECSTVEECEALLEKYEKEIQKYQNNINANRRVI